MLRYLEHAGLVVPGADSGGLPALRPRELNQLRSLAELRRRFGVGVDGDRLRGRLRREPALRAAVETLARRLRRSLRRRIHAAWVEWEQRKHERLLAA